MATREPPSIRILVYGLDADLQLTREMLLKRAGYVVDAAQNQDSFEALLCSDRTSYRLVVICHTVAEDEQSASATLARQRNARVLVLKAQIASDEFLARLSTLLTG